MPSRTRAHSDAEQETEAAVETPAKPVETPAKPEGTPTVTTPDNEKATEDNITKDQPAHPTKNDATPAAETHENEHTMNTPAGQEGRQVASMLQEAGLAEMLSVSDVLKALEHEPTKVTYTVRAIAWNKLNEEEQLSALRRAREHRGALELPSLVDLSLEKHPRCQTVKSQLTNRASAQPGQIRARLVRVLRTAVAEIRIPL